MAMQKSVDRCIKVIQNTGKQRDGCGNHLLKSCALYLEMGDYTRAEEDLRESVDIYERLDTNHQVHLASVYNSLGILYYKQGKLEEAKEAYQQALELTLYHYGKNHEYEILCRNIAAIEEAVRNA